MSELLLVKPSERYLGSYLEACREYKRGKVTTYSLHDPDTFDEWRHTIFKSYEEQQHERFLKPGYVPSTTFWSVMNGEFAGIGNIRHRLTDSLKMHGGHIGYAVRATRWGQGLGTTQLALLLKEAALMGIDPALVTCNLENRASARVIEKNGGLYVDTVPNIINGASILTCRYWVPTRAKARAGI